MQARLGESKIFEIKTQTSFLRSRPATLWTSVGAPSTLQPCQVPVITGHIMKRSLEERESWPGWWRGVRYDRSYHANHAWTGGAGTAKPRMWIMPSSLGSSVLCLSLLYVPRHNNVNDSLTDRGVREIDDKIQRTRSRCQRMGNVND